MYPNILDFSRWDPIRESPRQTKSENGRSRCNEACCGCHAWPDPNSLKCNNALSLDVDDDNVRTKDLVSDLGLSVRRAADVMRILIDLGPRQKERERERGGSKVRTRTTEGPLILLHPFDGLR